MKKILLTGASGFVGRNFLDHIAKDASIAAIKFEGDIRDVNALEAAFSGQPFDAIVHLAAVIKDTKENYDSVNVEGTRNLVKLAEKYGVKRFIFLSSDFVLYEKEAPNLYGISKRQCEEIIFASSLGYTVFRPAPIFGPKDTKNFVSLAAFVKKFPVIPVVSCMMEPVFVGDVVKMIVAALENPKALRQVYALPGGKQYTLAEIFRIIAKNLGLRRFLITLPGGLFLVLMKFYEMIFPKPLLESYQVKKWLKNKPLDAAKTKADLGYAPVSFEEKASFIAR